MNNDKKMQLDTAAHEPVLLNDALIAKKIASTLKVGSFSFKKLFMIMFATIVLICISDLLIVNAVSKSLAGSPAMGAVIGFVSLVVGIAIVFSAFVFALHKSYVITTAESTPYAYIKYCKTFLANVTRKDVFTKEGATLYVVSYEFRGRSTKAAVEEKYFKDIVEGEECYFLVCPSAIRNDAVTRTRTYVFPRRYTKYEGTPDLRDIRTSISPFR